MDQKSTCHIHTLDDPKDAVDYSAHQLLERARALGFRVLAITLHDAVFKSTGKYSPMPGGPWGILLIPRPRENASTTAQTGPSC